MSYSSLFLHHRLKVFFGAVIGLVIFLVVSAFFSWEYSATARLLVIPSSSIGVDPYTAVKSAERISENLVQIVQTSSFFDRVLKTEPQFNFDASIFSNLTERERREKWDKMIVTEVIPGTGLFSVTAYNKNRDTASAWANAVSFVLSTQGYEYTSSNVQIKIVDTPLVSRFITRPNFLLVGFLGLIIGFLASAGLVLWKYE